MAADILQGIRRALTLALRTAQSVNVSLNRGGEAVKIEGVIQWVGRNTFRIRLELADQAGQLGPVETVEISEVEYVEFS